MSGGVPAQPRQLRAPRVPVWAGAPTDARCAACQSLLIKKIGKLVSDSLERIIQQRMKL